MSTFEEFRKTLPIEMRRGDQKRARQRFDAIVAAGHWVRLDRATKAYLADQKRNKWRGFLYLPSFLGRWEEFAMDGFYEERTELLFDDGDGFDEDVERDRRMLLEELARMKA